MEDEQVQESSESTEVTETPVSNDKPAGYHPVDPETASPEEVKNRIDYLYRQVKDQGRHLGEYRTIAQQQSQQINDLMNGVGQVVDHLSAKSNAETEDKISERMKIAFETGDTKTYLKEQRNLIDFLKQTPAPKQQTQTRQQAYAGSNSAAQVAADSDMSYDDKSYVSAWQEETDERGQPLRPWTKTDDPKDPDPDFLKGMAIAKRIWDKYPDRSIKENLAEVDKQMGTQSRGGGQNVMGGNLTTPQKKSKLTLSPDQERIAVKTRFGSKQGAKTDAEYISAYRKQIEKVQSRNKGAR